MNFTVRIHNKNGVKTTQAEQGTNLLDFIRSNSIMINSPCGGNGSCGKCRVKVDGLNTPATDNEKMHLGEKSLSMGFRLACNNYIESDLDLYTDDAVEEASIISEGIKRDIKLNPLTKKEYVELPVPQLDDQISDIERVFRHLAKTITPDAVEISLLRDLPRILRTSDFKTTLVYSDNKLIAVEPGNTSDRIYGAAFDIGTTTIVGYLYELGTGRFLDVRSMLNTQRRFGADVISRIQHAMVSQDALDQMNMEMTNCINQILKQFTDRNHIDVNEIYTAVFVGNTTMMHFFMKLDAGNMAVSPFIPASTGMYRLSPKDADIDINKNGIAIVFPCVSAYIGADTIAAVLSSGMYEDENTSLLIDIGTNGEIVLGNKKWLYSCSAAAGPAFEGANIRNGVGGIAGAIDTVRLVPEFSYTTIGKAKPLGICGSGVVDAVAQMLVAGIIDETGRIVDKDETAGLDAEYIKRLVAVDGMSAFLLASGSDNNMPFEIAITQRDIRELQNAKAAIAAGIATLVKHAGIDWNDIKKVYLAGGFGSRININSALGIGLLPAQLKGRIISIGNAAGSGAVEGLLSQDMLMISEQLKTSIKYVELSASANFTEEYVNNMMFE